MWVEETKNGYRLVERYTDAMTGKRKKVSVKLSKNTPQEINKASHILMNKIDTKQKQRETNLTLNELYEEFKSVKFPALRPNTKRNYEITMKVLRQHLNFDTPIDKLTPRLITLAFSQLSDKYTKTTLTCYKKELSSLFNYAVSMDLIHKNPMPNVQIYSSVKKISNPKFLNHAQVSQLLTITESFIGTSFEKYAVLTELLLFTGLRIGEALALKPQDIDLENKTLNVNKSLTRYGLDDTKTETSRRIISLMDRSVERLAKFEHGKEFFFEAKKNHSPLSQESYRGFLNNHIHIDGIKVHPHLLRHTHISMLAELGVNIKTTMKRVGHADSATTLNIYTHVTDTMETDMMEKLNNY